MNHQNISSQFKDDEIDLRELWKTLFKHKLTIVSVTAVVTVAAVIYAWTAAPIYKGEVLIEIGDIVINSESVNDKPTFIQPIDSPNDLKETITQFLAITYDKNNNFSVESPKGSTKLIKISYEDSDKAMIKQKLETSVHFVIQRHKNKAKFFQKANAQIRPSSIVGSINIQADPVKPKKKLIVVIAFVSGLILGVLTAFFGEFLQNTRNRKK